MHYILLSLLFTIAALTPARAADWMARIADPQRDGTETRAGGHQQQLLRRADWRYALILVNINVH